MPRDRTLSIATFFYPITAHDVNDGYSITNITYDGLGNIRYYQHKKHTLTYAYDNNNRLTFIDSPQKPYDQFYYDDRGNVTDNSYHQFTYNRADQLAINGSNSYIYDGYNRRVVAQEGSKTNYSVYSRSGQLLHTKSAEGGVNYIYLNKKLIAKDGVVPRNSAKQHYLPFGGSIEGEKNDVGYTGHKFDTALNLSYMQARYYDPVIGRFYSNDPIGFTGDVATFNRYAYVGNDPINMIDPSGRSSISVHFKDQPIHYPLAGKTYTFPQSISLGHSGVVIIDDKTGLTRYREFGRYDGSSGKVRGTVISNLTLDKQGIPTAQSLYKVFGELKGIGAKAGSSDIGVVFQLGGNFEKMMQETKSWANKTWLPPVNSCHSFADSVVDAGGGDGATIEGNIGANSLRFAEDVRKSYGDNGMSSGNIRVCSGMGAQTTACN